MEQEDKYFRPPSEADSFIIRVMRGCSYNACAFCGMFKDVPLQVLPLEEVLRGMEADAREMGQFLPLITSLYLEADQSTEERVRALKPPLVEALKTVP